jgi:hypothetical protein
MFFKKKINHITMSTNTGTCCRTKAVRLLDPLLLTLWIFPAMAIHVSIMLALSCPAVFYHSFLAPMSAII